MDTNGCLGGSPVDFVFGPPPPGSVDFVGPLGAIPDPLPLKKKKVDIKQQQKIGNKQKQHDTGNGLTRGNISNKKMMIGSK